MSPEQFGPYLVYEELGSGGMATVHRAEIRSIEGFSKPVALKRMHPYLASSPDTVKAFVREAQLASALHHGNIAQTFELGKAKDVYFIAMEYVPGPTLSQVIRQCQLAAGAIPIRITLGILIQICDALDYAHNHTDEAGKPLGIIHRDVSPSNIVVSNTGIVKLFDFGIAKVAGKEKTDTPLTGVTIKGKFDYIAPEYLGNNKLDVRADLFALGVIAHELLTGRKLFAGADDFETTTMVLEMPIPPPSRHNAQVPHELDAIVLTALQRDPALRWQSANALQRALIDYGHVAKAIPSNTEILEWVRWAFAQVRREDASGEIERVLDMLDQPSSVEVILSADQRRELDEFAEVIPTMPGVGMISARPANPSLLEISGRVSIGPMPAMPTPRPLIVSGEPLAKKRPSQGVAAARMSAPIPIPAEESGEVLAPARPGRRGWRIAVFLLILLVAAGAGAGTTAYLLDLELPLIGRW